MLNIKYATIFSFFLFLFLDYLIKNNYLGQLIKQIYFKFIALSYFSIVLLLFIISFLILMLFSYFDISLIIFDFSLFEDNLIKFISDSDDNNTSSGGNTYNINTDTTVNLNHPSINVSLLASSLNNAAAALSVGASGGLAFKVMQQMPGGSGTKAVADAGTMLGTQALTIGMNKILNSNNTSNNNKTQNFTNLIDNLTSFNNNNLNEYPLNLLPEINQLATAELMFLFVILNIYIVKYITTIDYNKYIPNNKIGNILKLFINRYIMIWSKSIKLLLIIS
jgi:hypothetical protein